jgi:hypothetical protein
MKTDLLDANLSIAVAFWHLKCDRGAESIMFLLPESGVLRSDPYRSTSSFRHHLATKHDIHIETQMSNLKKSTLDQLQALYDKA